MKENKDITSEDYLDSLLNSIMDNKASDSGSDKDDMSLFDDSASEKDDNFFENLEDELFNSVKDTDVSIIDDEDYFENEITDAEIFDLDDDIMSLIEETSESSSDSKKIHEIIRDDEKEETSEEAYVKEKETEKEATREENISDEIAEAIEVNDSSVDDNLQGLLDVMGIDEKDDDTEPIPGFKEKKKRKLFGNKKSKAEKEKKEERDEEELNPDAVKDMVNLLSLGNTLNAEDYTADSYNDNNVEDNFVELDFSSMDLPESDENDKKDMFKFDDLADLDAEDEDEEEVEEEKAKKGKKKEKKKKEKKEKVKKAKEKKAKPPKKPKKAKEKKAKEPDEIVHISKAFIFFAFTLIFVFVFSVIFGGDYYTYNKKISTATKEYVNKNYTVAYETIFGLKMKKDDDKELYNQIQTIMLVNRHYEAYENLIRMDEYEQGLYSLLKGVKMFDKYQNEGRKLNCYDDMQNVLGWIDRGLLETYGLTESQARELNLINNDDKLALEVCTIAGKARDKAEAERKAAEEAAKAEEKNEKND